MKKTAVILLICIYALATMGFSLKQFYCCGRLASVTVSFTTYTYKDCNKNNQKTGCCENKYQFFKVKDKHVTAAHANSFIDHFIELPLPSYSFSEYTYFQKILVTNGSNAPPLHYSVPVYLSNCVFRV